MGEELRHVSRASRCPIRGIRGIVKDLQRFIQLGLALDLDLELSEGRAALVLAEKNAANVCYICMEDHKDVRHMKCCAREDGSSWICNECADRALRQDRA